MPGLWSRDPSRGCVTEESEPRMSQVGFPAGVPPLPGLGSVHTQVLLLSRQWGPGSGHMLSGLTTPVRGCRAL